MSVTKINVDEARIFNLNEQKLWQKIRKEAEDIVANDCYLKQFIQDVVLSHDNVLDAVIDRIANLLSNEQVSKEMFFELFNEAVNADRAILDAMVADLVAYFERDPAADRFIEPLLYFKGYHAICSHRLGHYLYKNGRKDFAFYLQNMVSRTFGVDIHPNAPIGQGVFIDHATGVVVGETAVIEDDVSIMQGVTLGGTGNEGGDRHPKVRKGVLIGAGAKILGNIEIGHCVRVGAGSVVLKNVPPNKTVVGVPAKIVGQAGCSEPSRRMDQMLDL